MEYPHEPYTVGFTKEGGLMFYMNLQNNDRGHGRAGDPCFARIMGGVDDSKHVKEK